MKKRALSRTLAIALALVLALGSFVTPTMAAEEDGVVIKLHYHRPDEVYTDWSVWFWNFGQEGTDIPFAEENGEMVATFPVASGGTYIIEGERSSVIDKNPGWGSLPAGDPIPMMEFTDVKRSDWFYEEVRFVFGRELMNGVSSDRFAPHDTLTRAMVVQVLYNMAGRPDCGSEAFADVDANDWYYDAVAWASAENIVTGVTADTFAPMAPVTREQLAAMLFRYAVANGLEAVSTVEYLNAYPDAADVSEWAVSAMNWAVGQGLINGIDGKLLPGGSATRAQTAAILMRYCQ